MGWATKQCYVFINPGLAFVVGLTSHFKRMGEATTSSSNQKPSRRDDRSSVVRHWSIIPSPVHSTPPSSMVPMESGLIPDKKKNRVSLNSFFFVWTDGMDDYPHVLQLFLQGSSPEGCSPGMMKKKSRNTFPFYLVIPIWGFPKS